jgi:hypothetical protein
LIRLDEAVHESVEPREGFFHGSPVRISGSGSVFTT